MTSHDPSPMLHFLGGAGAVTGSRFLLEIGRSRVLVDCGLYQGRKELRLRNWSPFPVPPDSIDAVVISHSHVDHVGYLPALVRDGFRGHVWMSPFTAELATIVLADAARLQEEEADYANRKGYSKHRPAQALYNRLDAERAIGRFRPLDFGHEVAVAPGVHVTLNPAGHILGASTVTVRRDDDAKLLFTGDLGRPSHPLLTPPTPLGTVDVLVAESTYGNRLHEDQDVALAALADVITRTAERGGMVVIPAFAVDRTEVVLMALGDLVRSGRIPSLPIYADSPMALSVLDVYRRAIAEGSPEIRPGIGTDVFDVAGELHEAPTTEDSRALNQLKYPSIIVSASGMATGGRVLHHLSRLLPNQRNSVVLPGFQAPGTRGQALADGARTVKMLGQYVPVRAEVLHCGAFSVHADADEMLAWMGAADLPPSMTFLVHGEPDASEGLRDRIRSELDWPVAIPALGERVRIDY